MLSVSYNVKNINALYANRFGDRSKEKMQLLADEGKYCVLYLFLIQSITTITRTHWQANMPQGSERSSLQSPSVASCGICQFSLGPALKKYVKQIEGVQRRAACFIENCNAGTRNSYQPLERVKLDTAEGTKNNQEQWSVIYCQPYISFPLSYGNLQRDKSDVTRFTS